MHFPKLSLLIAFFAVAFTASATPIQVSYTVTGSSGNWTLDFSVTNNEIGTDQAVYLFGVMLNARDVVGSPIPYDPTVYPTWTNSGLGGSNTLYNNVWLDSSESNLLPGQTLSGFDVHVADLMAPQAVPWFAFSIGNIPYAGNDYFGGDPTNPGFEGVATPEPGTWIMFFAALSSLLVLRRGRVRPIALALCSRWQCERSSSK